MRGLLSYHLFSVLYRGITPAHAGLTCQIVM